VDDRPPAWCGDRRAAAASRRSCCHALSQAVLLESQGLVTRRGKTDDAARLGQRRSIMRTGHLLMTVVVSLALAAPAAAQMQIATADIEGTLVDATAADLPGVDAEIRNAEPHLTSTLATAPDGPTVALQL